MIVMSNISRPALVKQIHNRQSAKRQPVAMAEAGQPPGNTCGRFALGRGFGQADAKHILSQRFLGRMRLPGFPEPFLFRS
jgi:hypothetical protein